VRTKGDLTILIWRDKRDMHMLTNMDSLPQEGHFCDENGNAENPVIRDDYNRNMGCLDKGDRMADSCTVGCCTWRWTKTCSYIYWS
jgi:hypothetical protein